MNLEETFEVFLKKKDSKGAFNWVMEKMVWDPDNAKIRGMSAFAFRLQERWGMARQIAEEVLNEEPDEEWALATLFSTTNRLFPTEDFFGSAFTRYSFFGEEGFKLSHIWITRFGYLKDEDEAKKLIYCLARFGSPLQKSILSENWLVGNEETDERQLELNLGMGNNLRKNPGG